MKRAIVLLGCLILIFLCVPKPETPERFVEDGVEVVFNRLEPYEIKGEPSTFTLEREFAIDTEQDEIAKLGLTDINLHFDVDSAGNIYLACHKNADGMIFRFDRQGNFGGTETGGIALSVGGYIIPFASISRLTFP